MSAYEKLGRPAFIGLCKEVGVTSLPERQRVATAIGKLVKERMAGRNDQAAAVNAIIFCHHRPP